MAMCFFVETDLILGHDIGHWTPEILNPQLLCKL